MKFWNFILVCIALFISNSAVTQAITINSAYVEHYRYAEVGASYSLNDLNEEVSIVEEYSDFEPDFFAASTGTYAFSNPGSSSVSASANGWLRYRQENNPNNYTLDGRVSIDLRDYNLDFNASSYARSSFNQWFDFTVSLNEDTLASTSMIDQQFGGEYIVNRSMQTRLFVVETGEITFTGATNSFNNEQFSLNSYKGQTLRFQTSGEIEALMPQNIDSQNSYGSYSIESRLFLQTTPSIVPVPAAIWLFCSGLVGLVGFARHRKYKS